jgi:hypothetical protein
MTMNLETEYRRNERKQAIKETIIDWGTLLIPATISVYLILRIYQYMTQPSSYVLSAFDYSQHYFLIALCLIGIVTGIYGLNRGNIR